MFIKLTEVYNLKNCYPEFPNKWIGDTKVIEINPDYIITLSPLSLKINEEHIVKTVITYDEEEINSNIRSTDILVKETISEIKKLISDLNFSLYMID